ncbi:MAG: enoyl-CoA hydratase/isomerase family protein [Solirubrobacterales bacterium]
MYESIKVEKAGGVARVLIDNPPLNLLDAALMTDLDAFISEIADDESTKVVVVESADPDFFVAHGDMGFVDDPESIMGLEIAGDQTLSPMLRLHERLRALPQVTIGKLAGLARGGGSELLLAMDMRFAAIESAGLAQNEAAIGIIPGGGGSVYLPRLAGRSRALEVILGGRLFDAVTAERYGLVNRALPAADLDRFVDRLARHIAALPPGVVDAAVAVVDAGLASHEDGVRKEDEMLLGLFGRPDAAELTRAVLAAGAQTREGERDLEALVDGLVVTGTSPDPARR